MTTNDILSLVKKAVVEKDSVARAVLGDAFLDIDDEAHEWFHSPEVYYFWVGNGFTFTLFATYEECLKDMLECVELTMKKQGRPREHFEGFKKSLSLYPYDTHYTDNERYAIRKMVMNERNNKC